MKEEKSSKPREMVHRAQASASEWQHKLEKARQDIGRVSEGRAQKEYHAALMAYWQQISRFSNRAHIWDLWHDESVGDYDCLDQLREKRLETETVSEEVVDEDTNQTHVVEKERPWTLEPRDALAVHEQLDQCAHKLGFDARPEEQHDHTEIEQWPWEDDDVELPHEQVEVTDS